jgi:hypothetical protein
MLMRFMLLYFLVTLLLGTAHPSWAQQDSFNPSSTWASRLQVTPKALYLPASKRQVRRAVSYVVIAGKPLLLEALHYDQQGRLDTSQEYTLYHDEQGSLQPLLQTQLIYHTHLTGDSLLSEVAQCYGPGTPYTQSRTAGAIPLAEPLLGKGAQAHQLLGPVTQKGRTLQAGPWTTWSWSCDPEEKKAFFHFGQRYGAHESSGCTTELDLAKRQLVAQVAGSHGGQVTYERRYEAHSQNYTEKRHSSWISGSGGATTAQDDYLRIAYWRKGLCRMEHFVVLSYRTEEGTCAEFDVYHQYTFY